MFSLRPAAMTRSIVSAAIVATVLAASLFALPLRLEAKGLREAGPPGEEPTVSLTVLTEKPHTIGDPIDIALSIHYDRNERVIYPEDDAHFRPFALRELTEDDSRARGGGYKKLIIYTVTAFQTGNLTVSPLPIQVGDRSLTTEAITIPILSVLPKDDADPPLKDIVGPYRARIRPLTILLILASLIAGFVLFLLISRYLEKRIGTKVPDQHARQVVDPYRHALDALRRLKTNRTSYTDKEAYSEISHYLRLYFEHVMNEPVLEMTTRQIRQIMKRSPYDGDLLVGILQRSDLVKFARQKPSTRDLNGDVDRSIDLITETHRRRAAERVEETAGSEGEPGDDTLSATAKPADTGGTRT